MLAVSLSDLPFIAFAIILLASVFAFVALLLRRRPPGPDTADHADD